MSFHTEKIVPIGAFLEILDVAFFPGIGAQLSQNSLQSRAWLCLKWHDGPSDWDQGRTLTSFTHLCSPNEASEGPVSISIAGFTSLLRVHPFLQLHRALGGFDTTITQDVVCVTVLTRNVYQYMKKRPKQQLRLQITDEPTLHKYDRRNGTE
ncbi:hypothetical protein RB195_023256 [Necator americanus]|uniref:Uncharacterized protein n=1 Tax=Necator americanus TaxID=51031 RepID=A0ABR1EIQ0_NECAM